MDVDRLQKHNRFLVRQRVRPVVNQYEVRLAAPDGSEGELVAFAQQKRMAFKEQVTLYTDDSKTRPLASFKARTVIDLGGVYDVADEHGAPIGVFRKDFRRSLLSSTWHLDQPVVGTATGSERNQVVAVLRRVWDFIPIVGDLPFAWPYHFDFTIDGRPAFSVEKKLALRDQYVVDIAEPSLDRRLVIAQAVALDALQAR
ncbi:MAG: hypothetical protein IRY90_12860 [Actinomadura rubrobrunea]|nr:hypothetical protein [Actinomadura rubrobrunea]